MQKLQLKDKDIKTIVIHVEKAVWQSLRQISFDQEVSMSKLARDALNKEINNYKKDIDCKI